MKKNCPTDGNGGSPVIRRSMAAAGVAAFLAGGSALLIGWLWALIAAAVLSVGFVIPFLRRGFWFPMAVAVAVLLSSAGYQRLAVRPILQCVGAKDTVTGQITERNGRWYTLRIDRSEKLPAGTSVQLYCTDRCAPERYETVSASVTYDAVLQTRRSVYADRVFLSAFPAGYGDDAVTVIAPASPPGSVRFRTRLLRSVQNCLPGESGQLIAAVCLGERQGLSDEIKESFRRCGTSHILALSGLHMSVLIGGVFVLLRRLRLPGWLIALLSGGTVILFMWTVGGSSSIRRAGLMCLVMLFGQLVRERSDGLNSLGFAFCCLQLANPYCLYDAGLWLSFGATAGVLGLSPLLLPVTRRYCDRFPARLRPIFRAPAELVTVTLAALLPILPITVYLYRSVALLTPIANLLTVLPSEWMLLCGFVGIVLSLIPGLGFASRGFFLVAGWTARIVLTVTDRLSRIPGGLWEPGRFWVLLCVGVGCILLTVSILMHSRKAALRTVALMAALAVIGTVFDGISRRRYAVVGMTDGAVAATVSFGGHTVLLSPRAEDLESVYYMIRNGEYRGIDTLIVGSGKTTGAPYLARILQTEPGIDVILTAEGEWWRSVLPEDRVTVGCDISLFSGDGELTAVTDDWWLLRFRDTRLLLAADGADAAALPTALRQADGLLTAGMGPTDRDRLQVTALYWSMPSVRAGKRVYLPVTKSENVTLIDRDGFRVMTTGHGDWRK